MQTAINITGSTVPVNLDVLHIFRETVSEILESESDESTKVVALNTLENVFRPVPTNSTNISNCRFGGPFMVPAPADCAEAAQDH